VNLDSARMLIGNHPNQKGIGKANRLKVRGLRPMALVNRIYVIGHDTWDHIYAVQPTRESLSHCAPTIPAAKISANVSPLHNP
jgi:hypothetical protein